MEEHYSEAQSLLVCVSRDMPIVSAPINAVICWKATMLPSDRLSTHNNCSTAKAVGFTLVCFFAMIIDYPLVAEKHTTQFPKAHDDIFILLILSNQQSPKNPKIFSLISNKTKKGSKSSFEKLELGHVLHLVLKTVN